MTATASLPLRKDVPKDDCWDLSSLFPNDEAWETEFVRVDAMIATYETFRGRLNESAEVLAEAMVFDSDFDRKTERLGYYSFLKTTEDQSDSNYQGMKARFQNLAVRASQAASFIRPELLAIPADEMTALIEHESLSRFRLSLERLLRYRPHTLTDNEERLLAMQGEMSGAAYDDDLTFDARFFQSVQDEMDHGTINNGTKDFGKITLHPGPLASSKNNRTRLSPTRFTHNGIYS